MKDAAKDARENIAEQLKAIEEEQGCTLEQAICVLDGIIKASLTLARDYKNAIKDLKIESQN